jgi:hypothetical protein
MPDAEVGITTGTGAEVDVTTVTTGAGTVNRQTVSIGDPGAGEQRAQVDSAGNLHTAVTLPVVGAAVFGQAQVATANTAVQLPSNAVTQGVVVQALRANTDQIYVGSSSSLNTTHDGTGNGFELQPGQSLTLAVSNTNAIWINSATAGSAVCFAGA